MTDWGDSVKLCPTQAPHKRWSAEIMDDGTGGLTVVASDALSSPGVVVRDGEVVCYLEKLLHQLWPLQTLLLVIQVHFILFLNGFLN